MSVCKKSHKPYIHVYLIYFYFLMNAIFNSKKSPNIFSKQTPTCLKGIWSSTVSLKQSGLRYIDFQNISTRPEALSRKEMW